MPLYITVSCGPRADTATPILASSDQQVVNAVLRALARLEECDPDERDETDVTRRLLREDVGNEAST